MQVLRTWSYEAIDGFVVCHTFPAAALIVFQCGLYTNVWAELLLQQFTCLSCSWLWCGSVLGIHHVSSSCAIMRVPIQSASQTGQQPPFNDYLYLLSCWSIWSTFSLKTSRGVLQRRMSGSSHWTWIGCSSESSFIRKDQFIVDTSSVRLEVVQVSRTELTTSVCNGHVWHKALVFAIILLQSFCPSCQGCGVRRAASSAQAPRPPSSSSFRCSSS